MEETLTEKSLTALRECKIPSLCSVNYLSIDNLDGKKLSTSRYFAECLADELKDRKIDPKGLCILALDILTNFHQQVIELRKEKGKPLFDEIVDPAVIGGLYGSLRGIAKDIFSPEFAKNVNTILAKTQKEYHAKKYQTS